MVSEFSFTTNFWCGGGPSIPARPRLPPTPDWPAGARPLGYSQKGSDGPTARPLASLSTEAREALLGLGTSFEDGASLLSVGVYRTPREFADAAAEVRHPFRIDTGLPDPTIRAISN